MIKTAIAKEILHAIPISSRKVGSGISKVAKIATSRAAKIILLFVAMRAAIVSGAAFFVPLCSFISAFSYI